jgi:uridine kinase
MGSSPIGGLERFRERSALSFSFNAYNDGMKQKASPVVIGIAGGTGSGKTTVANVILDRVGTDSIAFLPHDAYYKDLHDLPPAQRTLINFDHPESLETELLVQHLNKLRQWQAVDIPIYDFTNHSRTNQTQHIEPQPVILVEGILIFADLRRYTAGHPLHPPLAA